MLQYPCASPRPRRGPGEVSVAVVSSSPPPLPQICFCWWQQRGAAAASLLVKFMTRRDTGTKPPLLLLRIILSPLQPQHIHFPTRHSRVRFPVHVSEYLTASAAPPCVCRSPTLHSCSVGVKGLSVLLSLPKFSVIRHGHRG